MLERLDPPERLPRALVDARACASGSTSARSSPPPAAAACVRDRVRFEPRLPLPARALLPLYRTVFRHRHRRLRRHVRGPPRIGGVIATADYELVTEAAGLVDRSDRDQAAAARRRRDRLPPGTGHQRRGGARPRHRLLRGDPQPQGQAPHRPARPARRGLGLARLRPGRQPRSLLHTVQTYSLGRDVSFQDLTAERSILSLVGPGGRGGARRGAPGRGARLRGGRARHVRAHRARRGRDHLRPGGRRARRSTCRRPPTTRSSAGGSRAAARASASTWTATRFRRRPASTSAPSASPRAATSARRRSRACTTRASRTATCAACGSPHRPLAATRSCSATRSWAGSARPASRRGWARSRSPWCAARPAPGDEVLVAGSRRHGGRAAVHG